MLILQFYQLTKRVRFIYNILDLNSLTYDIQIQTTNYKKTCTIAEILNMDLFLNPGKMIDWLPQFVSSSNKILHLSIVSPDIAQLFSYTSVFC